MYALPTSPDIPLTQSQYDAMVAEFYADAANAQAQADAEQLDNLYTALNACKSHVDTFALLARLMHRLRPASNQGAYVELLQYMLQYFSTAESATFSVGDFLEDCCAYVDVDGNIKLMDF